MIFNKGHTDSSKIDNAVFQGSFITVNHDKLI